MLKIPSKRFPSRPITYNQEKLKILWKKLLTTFQLKFRKTDELKTSSGLRKKKLKKDIIVQRILIAHQKSYNKNIQNNRLNV